MTIHLLNLTIKDIVRTTWGIWITRAHRQQCPGVHFIWLLNKMKAENVFREFLVKYFILNSIPILPESPIQKNKKKTKSKAINIEKSDSIWENSEQFLFLSFFWSLKLFQKKNTDLFFFSLLLSICINTQHRNKLKTQIYCSARNDLTTVFGF